MDAVVYTTNGQEYEMLSWILKEESPGLTVSRGVMDGEYHLEFWNGGIERYGKG